MWDDLRREFCGMDPYNTGHVTSEEFQEVLSELCVHLSDFELQMLTKKFDTNKNGRLENEKKMTPYFSKMFFYTP